MKVAIYARISTSDQNLDNQINICRRYCKNENHEVFAIYKDTISGTKASRPQFNMMLEDMRAYKFDCIIVTKLDRLGRSLQHLLSLIEEFTKKGIHFIATTQNIDTSSSMGKLQLHIMGAFAEFERSIISERTKEGLRYAKNVGKRGKDKKPRRKRGVFKKPLPYLNKQENGD